MRPDTTDPNAYLVVDFQSAEDQVAQIVAILRHLDIGADVIGPSSSSVEPAVAVRVPVERVVAAVLALEQHGFTRVRAYGGDVVR